MRVACSDLASKHACILELTAMWAAGSTQQQQQPGQAATNMEQQLSGLEKAYLDVVQRLNAAVAKSETLDAATEFAAASTSALKSTPTFALSAQAQLGHETALHRAHAHAGLERCCASTDLQGMRGPCTAVCGQPCCWSSSKLRMQ